MGTCSKNIKMYKAVISTKFRTAVTPKAAR